MDEVIQESRSHTDNLSEKSKALIKESIRYLDGALLELDQSLRKARIDRIYRLFFRPLALFSGLTLASLLAVGFYFLGVRGSFCFTLGVLCYMIPLLTYIMIAKGERNLEHFWPEIHRADEAIAEVGEASLLLWPDKHPEEGWENGGTYEDLAMWIEKRRQQLEDLSS